MLVVAFGAVGMVVAVYSLPALEWLGSAAGLWLPNTVVGVAGGAALTLALRSDQRQDRRLEAGPLPKRPRLGCRRHGQAVRAFLWLWGRVVLVRRVVTALDGGSAITVFGPLIGTYAVIAGQRQARHGRALEDRAREAGAAPAAQS